ncbi:phosphate ABC transporter, inner membrane subunit PstA [Desulfofarcimen acetoxidans DSM 771]|uniref:Phosphate transport system permease protein PstA n=1 Tax=Desulfofarcimen acetoxidans (strain ATCC 49208 / DSM 771 / KCTC 5769 / VKM B-1644 / 5575) TaxID=485916 RepID=C8W2T3_DESAS|nr:phosphate ABC transporter permease PstA [Desulfofarcimen acetoxidans]ACV61089.1 phosphate ABC transporter, inner membrane subunit PstA [Desulfofarcimen acetoxidans DSM 771]
MTVRKWLDRLWLAVFWGAGLLILVILFSILGYLFYRGWPSLSIEFLTLTPKGLPLGSEGGVWPAITGTVYLVLIAVAAAGIPGITAAIYLVEGKDNQKFKQTINLIVQCMAGIPSIIIGLFGYSLLVVYLGFGISLLAGGLTLGIMIFPLILITARDALSAVNENYRLIGISLGVSRRYILARIIFPQAMPSILSGLLLAMGYAAGATAPIMVTAAVISAGSPGSLLEPVMALPYHLYTLFSQQISLDKAYGTALLLVLLLLAINITALCLRGCKRKGV